MKKILLTALMLIILLALISRAEKPETFEEAKKMARDQGKPLLIEFYREDCEFCQKAEDDFTNIPVIGEALEQVVYYKTNLLTDDGRHLDSIYKAGISFPLFILANSEGDPIVRWSGYSQPNRFVEALNHALEDQTTVKERMERVRSNPNYPDSYFLANYFAGMEEHMAAVRYYKQAQNLGASQNANFEYEIFSNTADAAWKDQVSLDSVYPAAERFMNARGKTLDEIGRFGMGLSRLARKYSNTDSLGKYLDYALKTLKNPGNAKLNNVRMLLLSEHALMVKFDTTAAIEIQKSSMGEGWEDNPSRYYRFARWCLERRLNLEEAERYARMAVQRAPEGEFKAGVYSTLAEICYERGKIADAVMAIEKAIDIYPDNPSFMEKWEKYVEGLEEGKSGN